MSPSQAKLSIAAAVLGALSVFSYVESVSRADRFESGQKFLPNLDPDSIAGVVVRGAESTVTLTREGDRFVVAEAQGYRARNDTVNRLVRDLLELELERRAGSGDDLAREVGLEPLGEGAVEITLSNASGAEMVAVRIGDRVEEGQGRFVQRVDGNDRAIYRSASGASFDDQVASYLEKEIVDVQAAAIERIEGADFVLARGEEGGALELVEPAGSADSADVSKLSSFLNRLRFEQVFVADDPEVAPLRFEPVLRYALDDQSGYVVYHAESEGRHFVRLNGFFGVESIEITRDTPDDELEEKSKVLKRADEIDRFNQYHGSWVYELAEYDAEKLALRASDLAEG
ncbi:MAG TPA: DUF4340 domain-containing protein, partial [Thermoanaerobaculia bacterium]|nr:DUF4340 domain-containing protein [Thermoanaerobaculia bacterium]